MDWLQKAFNEARITKMDRKTFFSSRHEADVHLKVATYVDGAVLGSVSVDGGDRLYFGRHAERVFHEMQAEEETRYAIIRAQVRAAFGFNFPHDD